MTFDYIDRRKHPRFNVEKAIFIEVVGATGHSEAENTIIRCETLDVSAGGLGIASPIPIEKGTMLNIAVPVDDWKENLELVGQAVWCKKAGNGGGHWVGLELQDSSREDMEKWFKVVQALRSRSGSGRARLRSV